ncbi:hypothetical protein PMAYCL1PPCAC_13376, partial [Pristionchus mayeri]
WSLRLRTSEYPNEIEISRGRGTAVGTYISREHLAGTLPQCRQSTRAPRRCTCTSVSLSDPPPFPLSSPSPCRSRLSVDTRR